MALHQLIASLAFALLLMRLQLSACHPMKGSVTCLDCNQHSHDLSDIKVLVKCSQVKKLGMASTKKDGSFETELPVDTSLPSTNCLAKVIGGPTQIYASRESMVSQIVKSGEPNSFTISSPLNFYTSCPIKGAKCGAQNTEFGSSKTVDLPIPREWGLAPTSYYVPFLPIIGIP
ncbi:uncharacterized protein LOC132270523 [Cornus florida]|uniref:uncharacterized protein LOC132270523 n=1 Tax=Cornus florida TaxID=4283 RepID=UPI0028A1E2EA|nr:uncharacterized protein LOC132270523 [Cornus florida]